jgi:hypothetical protein
MQVIYTEAKDCEQIEHATEIRMRAEIRTDELLREMAERKELHDGKGQSRAVLRPQAATVSAPFPTSASPSCSPRAGIAATPKPRGRTCHLLCWWIVTMNISC